MSRTSRTLAFLGAVFSLCGAWNMAFAAAPANDAFGRPQVLTGLEGRTTGTTREATFEAQEPLSLFTTRSSVWYRWVAPVNGRARFTASGNAASLTLAVYSGSSVSALQRLRLQENLSESATTFDAQARVIYWVQVATDAGNAQIPFALSWYQQPAPANDDFARAFSLVGSNGQIQTSLLGATREAGESGLLFGENSIWYRWIAPASGPARFASAGNEASKVSVYSGTTISNLTQVNGLFANAPFDVQVRTVYYVRISGFNFSNASTTLSFSGPGAPTFSVSGRVTNPTAPGGNTGVFNARVAVGALTVSTDGAGYFNVTGLRAGSYNVAAAAPGLILTPLFSTPVNVSTNVSNLLFRATIAPPETGSFLISGRVTDGSGRPLAGVLIMRTGNVRVLTNALGQYQFVVAPGSYSLTPTKRGYEFYPAAALVIVRRNDAPGINFYGLAGT